MGCVKSSEAPPPPDSDCSLLGRQERVGRSIPWSDEDS